MKKWVNVCVIKASVLHLDKTNYKGDCFALSAKVERSQRRRVVRVIGVWYRLNAGSQVFTTVLTELLDSSIFNMCQSNGQRKTVENEHSIEIEIAEHKMTSLSRFINLNVV